MNREDWKNKTTENILFNKYLDTLYLLKHPPMYINTKDIKTSELNPGAVIKMKWYWRLYNWLWNKFHK